MLKIKCSNCKNEDIIIQELKDLCEYKTDVFKENDKLKEIIDKYKAEELDKTKFINDFLNANPYKNAWEELKEDCILVEKENDYILYERLEQLEQKHNIGGNE